MLRFFVVVGSCVVGSIVAAHLLDAAQNWHAASVLMLTFSLMLFADRGLR